MTPLDALLAWQAHAPWVQASQVELDLVLSRVIVEIFRTPGLAQEVALRGGTALHKLYGKPARRFSEDIDLVQVHPGRPGPLLSAIRAILDPWLGTPTRDVERRLATILYRFQAEGSPPVRLRLKIEINTEEPLVVFGHREVPYEVRSPWFSGVADVRTFSIEELLATKLRALYQRRQGRDLFDLGAFLARTDTDAAQVATAFQKYLERTGQRVSRAEFEANLSLKLTSESFVTAPLSLLPVGTPWDPAAAATLVKERLLALLPGEPWKGEPPAAASRPTRTT